MLKKEKVIGFFVNLNMILILVGYQFMTSVLTPFFNNLEDATQIITIPYRAATLGISLLVVLLTIFHKVKVSFNTKLFWFFWVLYILRMYYDLFLRSDVLIPADKTYQLWLYVFGICMPQAFSVQRTLHLINFNTVFKWISVLVLVALTFTLFSNQMILMEADQINHRIGGNAAFSSINFGHFGATAMFLGVYGLVRKRKLNLWLLVWILLILLGLFSVIRSGSRGPFVAFILISIFWMFCSSRFKVIGIIVTAIAFILSAIFIDEILDGISKVSPLMSYRLEQTIYEGDTSEREPLYRIAIEQFTDHPFFGGQFAIFYYDDKVLFYPHNIILDAFMGLGFIGGIILLYLLISSIRNIYHYMNIKDKNYWIFILLLQQIMFNMASGNFYTNPLLSVLLVVAFQYKYLLKK